MSILEKLSGRKNKPPVELGFVGVDGSIGIKTGRKGTEITLKGPEYPIPGTSRLSIALMEDGRGLESLGEGRYLLPPGGRISVGRVEDPGDDSGRPSMFTILAMLSDLEQLG